jgi:hypothetical protein
MYKYHLESEKVNKMPNKKEQEQGRTAGKRDLAGSCYRQIKHGIKRHVAFST